MMRVFQLVTLVQTKRERVLKTVIPLSVHKSNKGKQVTFAQVHHDPSEVSDKTSSEISPILETYEQQLQTFQSSNTFETLDPTFTPSSNQPTTYHNESQPMTTHQRAALAQAALVNFFGEAGTVTSILNRVQPSHTQTLNEVSDEQNLDISQQGRSFPVLLRHLQYLVYHHPQIQLHNKVQTDKVTKYHIIIQILILLLIREE